MGQWTLQNVNLQFMHNSISFFTNEEGILKSYTQSNRESLKLKRVNV